jgi:hypothetical protein
MINESTTNIGGKFTTDLENGPKNHGSRPLGNWQSDNAWDVFAPAGTVVNSYTNGTVTKVYSNGKNSGKIYGTQVSIKGTGDYPDIFYTHLKNVKLKSGDTIKVGDVIGEISEWLDGPNMTHVHIGLPKGHHLKDLLKHSDKIFKTSGNTKKDSDDEKEIDSNDNVDDKEGEEEEVDNPLFKSLLGLMGFKENDESHEGVQKITENIIRMKKLMK